MNIATTTTTEAPSAQAQVSHESPAPAAVASSNKTKRSRRSKSGKLTASSRAPGDSMSLVSEGGRQVAAASPSQVSADVTAASDPLEAAKAEASRLQVLLRDTQKRLAEATKDEEPAQPISNEALKPLFAEHVRTGKSIGRWELTPEQKLAWKACKKSRKALINGRVYRKRVLGNVTRAANEGAFSRYRERITEKSKRLAGFTLGASFAAPKKAKADKPAGK